MKRFLLCSLGLLFFFSLPLNISREPLPVSFSSQDAVEANVFLPNISIAAPPKKEIVEAEENCALPADLSLFSEKQYNNFHSALAKVPCDLMQTLRTVEVSQKKDMPRALAGRSILKIRADALQKPEIEPLLIHEFCHIIDLGGLRGKPSSGVSTYPDGHLPTFANDLSVQFYQISWKNSTEQKSTAQRADFVSGYAMTDIFEDFAESCLFYRLHGKTFQQLAEQNEALQQKYNFFKEYVFDGQEFATAIAGIQNWQQPWDVTKL